MLVVANSSSIVQTVVWVIMNAVVTVSHRSDCARQNTNKSNELATDAVRMLYKSSSYDTC